MGYKSLIGTCLGGVIGITLYFKGLSVLSRETGFPVDYPLRKNLEAQIAEMEKNQEIKKYVDLREKYDNANMSFPELITCVVLGGVVSGLGAVFGGYAGNYVEDKLENNKRFRQH